MPTKDVTKIPSPTIGFFQYMWMKFPNLNFRLHNYKPRITHYNHTSFDHMISSTTLLFPTSRHFSSSIKHTISTRWLANPNRAGRLTMYFITKPKDIVLITWSYRFPPIDVEYWIWDGYHILATQSTHFQTRVSFVPALRSTHDHVPLKV